MYDFIHYIYRVHQNDSKKVLGCDYQKNVAKSNFDPVLAFLHLVTFGLLVVQMMSASKSSELEQFEKIVSK